MNGASLGRAGRCEWGELRLRRQLCVGRAYAEHGQVHGGLAQAWQWLNCCCVACISFARRGRLTLSWLLTPADVAPLWQAHQAFAIRFYALPAARALYYRYVRAIAARVNSFSGVRYTDDPTIFAWELANEPRPLEQVEAYRAWIDEVRLLTCL